MGENSKIQWTKHTFNPWIGCAKISPGCKHCYAEHETPARVSLARGLPLWGPKAHRQVTSPEYWRKPLAWNAAAKAAGKRHRVFCASMADVFELPMDLEQQIKVGAARVELWKLIKATPDLDWLILTKRPENMKTMLPLDWGDGYPNVWLGVSIESQPEAIRAWWLLDFPAAVRFVSLEPLLGPVNMRRIDYFRKLEHEHDPLITLDAFAGHIAGPDERYERKVDWAIIGGESGPDARHCDVEWVRSLVQQCRDTGVAPFVKQLGSMPVIFDPEHEWFDGSDFHTGGKRILELAHKKGGDLSEWPEDLRVREFPRSTP